MDKMRWIRPSSFSRMCGNNFSQATMSAIRFAAVSFVMHHSVSLLNWTKESRACVTFQRSTRRTGRTWPRSENVKRLARIAPWAPSALSSAAPLSCSAGESQSPAASPTPESSPPTETPARTAGLYVLELATGAVEPLAGVPPDSSALGAAVSPDGTRIAYSSDRKGPFDIYSFWGIVWVHVITGSLTRVAGENVGGAA